jgi:hypothetical protein
MYHSITAMVGAGVSAAVSSSWTCIRQKAFNRDRIELFAAADCWERNAGSCSGVAAAAAVSTLPDSRKLHAASHTHARLICSSMH